MAEINTNRVGHDTYTATTNDERFDGRAFWNPSLLKSSFAKNVPCGQSLAGSGALVFEGEIIELPRRSFH